MGELFGAPLRSFSVTSNKTNLLKTGKDGLIKSYITYDASDRMEYVYEARSDAENGEPCLRTQYTYDGTSNRVEKMEESASTWSSSYDI